MRVSFIGTGNVATQMARRLRQLGVEVVQMVHRADFGEFDPTAADVVIVAVTDGAIARVLADVPAAPDCLWLHTSGSVGIEVFDSAKFPRHGVLYPLQTMLREREADWSGVPLFVEGNDDSIGDLARQMSPMVAPLDSLSRRRLHAAAVMGCNLVMYLWSLSEQIMQNAGLDFKLLQPLMELTVQRALQGSPAQSMTGPARRGDLDTMRSHIAALPPEAAEVYRLLSQNILNQFHPESEKL